MFTRLGNNKTFSKIPFLSFSHILVVCGMIQEYKIATTEDRNTQAHILLMFQPNSKINKLKSLKVAQVKDEMDAHEDDGCDSVCDVA